MFAKGLSYFGDVFVFSHGNLRLEISARSTGRLCTTLSPDLDTKWRRIMLYAMTILETRRRAKVLYIAEPYR
jgi:hypothetical protein